MSEARSLYANVQDAEDSQMLDKVAMTPRRLRKTTLPDTVEKLQEELQNVLADLEQKQRDATLAAQYGSTLIQTNDKLRSELEEMNTKLDGAFESMNELHQNIAELNTQNAQLRTNNTVLTNQVKDAQRENQILLEEFNQTKEYLDDSLKKNRSIHTLQERKKDLEMEMEKLYSVRDEFEEVKQRESHLTLKYKNLQQAYNQQKNEIANFQGQLSELSEQLENQQNDKTKIQTLTNQLQQYKRSVDELKEEKKILEEMPLLSQFAETNTLHSLLIQNRSLLDNINFSNIESETKCIIDELINDSIDKDDKSLNTPPTSSSIKDDGKPTNSFYVLTAILMKKKCEEIEKQLKIDSLLLKELQDELSELRHEKNTFSQTLERSERKKQKIEEQLNTITFEHESQIYEIEQKFENQKIELKRLKDQLEKQTIQISSSQHDNEERLKRRIEELALLEVDHQSLQLKTSELQDNIKSLKQKLSESENRNSEFQEIIRKLNLEKGDLSQQMNTLKRENIALQKTKESQQEMLDSSRNTYRDHLTLINQLQCDLANLQELYNVIQEQIEVGKEEIQLLQSHNDLLNSQITKERKNHASQVDSFRNEIQELNELIQMMQALEEEQLELESQANTEEEGILQIQSTLRKENIELKKKLHDLHMENSLLLSEKQVSVDQLALLQDDINFHKKQHEKDLSVESQHREILIDQISQLQDRLKQAESIRKDELSNLEILKQRTLKELQQQLTKERSINESNALKLKRMAEQNRELEISNQDLVASMAMMIKDSSIDCKRIDDLEEKLKLGNIQHQKDTKTISELTRQIKILQQRVKLQRPYLTTLPPPTDLIITSFPILDESILIDEESNNLSIINEIEKKKEEEEENEENIINDNDKNNNILEKEEKIEEEIQTENELLSDVSAHIIELLPDEKAIEIEHKQIQESFMLCKLINQIVPGTIDERAINPIPKNKEEEKENLNLCLNSAKAIGCDVGTLQAKELSEDRSQLEKLTWEIVRTQLLSNVSIKKHPELCQLKEDMELQAQIIDIQTLTPDELLLHWINHHINNTEYNSKTISNFSEDLSTLQVHHSLLLELCKINEISIENIKQWNNNDTWDEKAKIVTELAELLDCNKFLYPSEIKDGNSQLNIAFFANVLHHHSSLKPIIINESIKPIENDIIIKIESDYGTREERALRYWINSLGIGQYVNNLQTDVRDGLILLKVFDKIEPGSVKWNQVNNDPNRLGMYRKLENCTLCIKYGLELGFSLVGIGGKDIFDGNRKFILALVWQMMHYQLLGILRQVSSDKDKKVTEKDVVKWANSKVCSKYDKECAIENLKSPQLQSSKFLAQLIDSVRPGSLNFDFIVESEGAFEENAKYIISIARKIGCCIFLVWEDIAELNPKMIFTLVATLMQLDLYTNN